MTRRPGFAQPRRLRCGGLAGAAGVFLAAALAGFARPAHVELRETAPDRYELRRDGAPYFVRGAGGVSRLDRLAACGANSLRTWGTEQTVQVLDEAGRLGLTVCAGLWVDHERHGFNYDDPAAVRAQIEKHCRDVDRFKDHPALLLWSVGNEVEIAGGNPKVWDVIEAVAAHIKKVDPHHPVMTVTAHISATAVAAIKERCPSIDLIGCNCYAGIAVIAQDVRAAGWERPYLIAEWGNDGNWEVPKLPWGAELEPTSTEKAAQRAARYAYILADPGRCLGGYAFYWGQKQEITPTWFNLFTEDGGETESVATLAALWRGQPAAPAGFAPQIAPPRLDGRLATEAVTVRAGAALTCVVPLLRADPAGLRVSWELLPESAHKGSGGDAELRPAALPAADAQDFLDTREARLAFAAPAQPGAYRLFVQVRGAGGSAATANFPFFVD